MRALRLYVQRTLNTRRPCDPSFWPSPEIRRLPPSSSHLCFGTSLRKPTCQRRRHRPKLAEVAQHSQECSGGPDSSPTSTRVGRVTHARPLVTQPTAASRGSQVGVASDPVVAWSLWAPCHPRTSRARHRLVVRPRGTPALTFRGLLMS